MGLLARRLPALLLPFGVGCLSPTLPMPPPAEPKIEAISSDGMSLHLEGIGMPPTAQVIATNEQLCATAIHGSCGGVTTADGSGAYAVDVPLDLPRYGANFVELYYQIHGELSGAKELRIPRFGLWSPPDAGAADAGAD